MTASSSMVHGAPDGLDPSFCGGVQGLARQRRLEVDAHRVVGPEDPVLVVHVLPAVWPEVLARGQPGEEVWLLVPEIRQEAEHVPLVRQRDEQVEIGVGSFGQSQGAGCDQGKDAFTSHHEIHQIHGAVGTRKGAACILDRGPWIPGDRDGRLMVALHENERSIP